MAEQRILRSEGLIKCMWPEKKSLLRAHFGWVSLERVVLTHAGLSSTRGASPAIMNVGDCRKRDADTRYVSPAVSAS